MTTLSDIPYASNTYSQVNPWVLILHQLDEASKPFPLSNARFIKFLQYIDSITTCQDHIKKNSTHEFTLFGFEENIRTWFYNNNPIPRNLEDITVFGGNGGRMFKAWARRYTKNIREVFTSEEFEQNLLMFGLKHVRDAMNDFEGNFGVLNLLEQDFGEIHSALSQCLEKAKRSCDNTVQTGVEET
ncbi:hypothetical protein I4U23_005890 [Adineta vaga]|nr:hypothetical protein I4U23_005890 [Adineta vaga]